MSTLIPSKLIAKADGKIGRFDFDHPPFRFNFIKKKTSIELVIVLLIGSMCTWLLIKYEVMEYLQTLFAGMAVDDLFLSLVPWSVLVALFVLRRWRDQKDSIRQLERVANHDAMTGIYNRAALDKLLANEFSRAERYKSDMVVMLLDVDYFKSVNDQYGHQAGDRVLNKVAGVIAQTLREYDVVGRYGGEEFMIILPSTRLHVAKEIAERIRQNVGQLQTRLENGALIQVTISIGIACKLKNTESAEQIVSQADAALYRAKDQGRNCCVAADSIRLVSKTAKEIKRRAHGWH